MTNGLIALRRHGDRPAVVGPDGGVLTYRELDERVAARAETFGPARQLLVLAVRPRGAPDPEALVDLLAAWRGGHVALPVADATGGPADLATRYRAGAVVRAGTVEPRDAPPPALHPDLALLLSTSGSTGSPKLVRLSADNVTANARQIGGYLPIRPTDRAPLTLPVHYCYGLSVLTSNLSAGAAVLLPAHSPGDDGFAGELRAHEATSLHGVPHTFALLDDAGFAEHDLPDLRYVTQAGGRWSPESVRRWAALGTRRGWSLYVMYGQTEATARMAYLPPDRVATSPSAVGVAVPEGALEVRDAGADGIGDVVFHGPNVMLGYGRGPDDLALGRTVDELRTGDRGRIRPDGMLELTGRASRFVKPFGIRVDLDRVDALLAGAGLTAVATGPAGRRPAGPAAWAELGDEVVVAAAPDAPADRVREVVARGTGLPAGAVRVVEVPEIPRTGAGKVDGAALAALTASSGPAGPAAPAPGHGDPSPAPGRRRSGPDAVRAVFRTAFPSRTITDADTFHGLGGDSLTSVQVGVGLRRVVAELPRDWAAVPVGTLAGLAAGTSRPTVRLDTPTVLRAVAIVLVVGSHVGTFRILGGAHVLLAVAGWTFAAFALDRAGGPVRPLLRTAAALAVPTAAWVVYRAIVEPDVDLVNAALVNYVVDPEAWGYWFVETLVQVLLLAALVFAIPAVRRFERARPWGCALLALVPAAALTLVDDGGNEFTQRLMSVPIVLWVFVLGWAAYRATTTGRRLVVAAATAVLVPAVVGTEPWRAAVIAAGLLLLLVPTVPVPSVLLRPIALVGGSSLAIYLTHYAVYPALEPLPDVVALAACLVVGIGAEQLRRRGAAALGAAARRVRPARRAGAPDAASRPDRRPRRRSPGVGRDTSAAPLRDPGRSGRAPAP